MPGSSNDESLNNMSMESSEGTSQPSSAHSADTQAPFPLQRVKAIVQTMPDCQPFAQDGLYAVAKAAELFAEDLLRQCVAEHGLHIDYDQVAATIIGLDCLTLMHDFFPARVPFSQVQNLLLKKEEEEEEESDSE